MRYTSTHATRGITACSASSTQLARSRRAARTRRRRARNNTAEKDRRRRSFSLSIVPTHPPPRCGQSSWLKNGDRVDHRAGAVRDRNGSSHEQELPSIQPRGGFRHGFEIEIIEDVDAKSDQRELVNR